MFANAEGISQRAPVNWSESVMGAAVCFPYVVALDEGFVSVHSMLDQQLKQTLSFRDGHILQDFEGPNMAPLHFYKCLTLLAYLSRPMSTVSMAVEMVTRSCLCP